MTLHPIDGGPARRATQTGDPDYEDRDDDEGECDDEEWEHAGWDEDEQVQD